MVVYRVVMSVKCYSFRNASSSINALPRNVIQLCTDKDIAGEKWNCFVNKFNTPFDVLIIWVETHQNLAFQDAQMQSCEH